MRRREAARLEHLRPVNGDGDVNQLRRGRRRFDRAIEQYDHFSPGVAAPAASYPTGSRWDHKRTMDVGTEYEASDVVRLVAVCFLNCRGHFELFLRAEHVKCHVGKLIAHLIVIEGRRHSRQRGR